jgi:zinc/manganese transport system ATP-binding protein
MSVDGGVVLRDVTVRYGSHVALDAVSGQFVAGSLTAVVGGNGAGKSTLLAAIAGAVRLSGGRVDSPNRERLAWLPQRAAINRSWPITVAELIALGSWREFGAFRACSPTSRERSANAAATVGLAGLSHRRINDLSEGEFQRALFARLILLDAGVILLDEPFAAVDARSTSVLLDQVKRWHEEGRTVIAVSHDLNMVRTFFPSVLVLARRCVSWGPTEMALAAAAA